jgi:hypothetical protein
MLHKSDNDPVFTVEEAVSPDICHTNKRETIVITDKFYEVSTHW